LFISTNNTPNLNISAILSQLSMVSDEAAILYSIIEEINNALEIYGIKLLKYNGINMVF